MAAFKDWLYRIVTFIARVHDSIIAYNEGTTTPRTDKELHFVVIGLLGLLLFLLAVPLFRFLTRKGWYGLMAWLFTFMTILFVTFSIEEGQRLTNTGNFQLLDIAYGVMGFLAVSAALGLIYLLYLFIRWLRK